MQNIGYENIYTVESRTDWGRLLAFLALLCVAFLGAVYVLLAYVAPAMGVPELAPDRLIKSWQFDQFSTCREIPSGMTRREYALDLGRRFFGDEAHPLAHALSGKPCPDGQFAAGAYMNGVIEVSIDIPPPSK